MLKLLIMKVTYFFILAILFISCNSSQKKFDFIASTEEAHLKKDFQKNDAVQFDVLSFFGKSEWINGTITLSTNSSNGKIEFKNGNVIVYNGTKVFYSKNIKDTLSIRFDAYTIPYFFLLPYKLSDSGTVFTDYPNKEKDNLNFNTQKLTFKSGTGDAPKDWYILYTDKKTNLLHKAAYIVTAMGSVEKAEKNPHAIEYLDYETINGIPVARTWKFWEWKKDIGSTKPIGNAKITNIKFIKTPINYFKPKSDFKEKK